MIGALEIWFQMKSQTWLKSLFRKVTPFFPHTALDTALANFNYL